jgi:hypothetical protein
VKARFARQAQLDGSADAVRVALRAGVELPAVAVAADTLYRPGDLGRFADGFARSGADGAIAVRRDPPPGPGRAAVRVEDGRVTKVPGNSAEDGLASAALWAVGKRVAHELDGLQGPPYELAEAFQRAIDAGALVAAVEIGPTRDLTRPLDLIRENFPYLSKER